ncbi:glycosyltransferase family 4 protein [Mediterranea massiliensis]|nr:glycosyltransferase family 4 protein [Mediterranea massiliensis]
MTRKRKIIRAVTVADSLIFIEPSVLPLKDKYEVQILSSPGERLNQMGVKYGVKIHPLYMFRRISPFQDLKSLYKLIRLFRRESPDIVHSMTPKAGLLCMLAAWITRVPRRVHTFTGLVWPTSSGISRRILMCTDWLTCACATHVIPEGQGVLNDLQKYITKKPMRVLGYGNVCGIDLKRFSRTDKVMEIAKNIRVNGVFSFLFVGRIVKEKGINELVIAFDELNKKYPATRLFLVGNYEADLGPLNPDTINKINSNSAINAVGAKFGNDLLAYYAASDCFVFPSYREGFPNVVIEAGAMGLPSIVTDINGSRDIIVDGKNGIIIPSKNYVALYNSMEQMILDEELKQSLASNAREMIEKRYEQSFVTGCLLDFYDKINANV